ncbi:MAG: glutamate synthase large subunit [Actinomycetota bacterium]|nr:glutamate synthase large subunit [Actinomycetota bacterium]
MALRNSGAFFHAPRKGTTVKTFDGERDACGIGFVADARGRASRALTDLVLDGLCRVKHRGAVAADALTGDGAGVLLPIPRRLLAGDTGDSQTGVAMCFLDPADSESGRAAVERALTAEGLTIRSWRAVPTEEAALGESACKKQPLVEQALIRPPTGADEAERERAAFRARRRTEQIARAEGTRLYLPSLSFRTVTYKALCAADQLASYYADLRDDLFESWFGLFHQRYSTNTTPSWERAQPFRFLAHNGEINTIRGNVALMRARESRLGADHLWPSELLKPAVDEAGSDSGILDEALELLVRSGRDLEQSMTMLMPPAWEDDEAIDPELRAFLHYHSCLLEPWDGPAALVFSDGLRVGAALDRNGLRPLRVAVCEDGVVACASEAGAVATKNRGRIRRLRLGPGQSFVVDPTRGGVLDDGAVKRHLSAGRPYQMWLRQNLKRRSTGRPLAKPGGDITARQVAAGYSKEEFTVVLRPMATEGAEPTSSMGDDTAQPPLAAYGRPVFNFLKQRFAQVTNPPIDHLRERHVMSITTRLGARAPLLDAGPEATRLREYESCVLYPSAVAELEAEGAAVLDATWPSEKGGRGLAETCLRIAGEAEKAVAGGADVVVVSDRAAGRDRVAVPSALAGGAVHHRLLAAGLRARASLVVECDDARETHHLACLLTNGADAVSPRLALESLVHLAGRGRLGGGVDASEGQRRFVSSLEDGLLKVMSKMGISTLDSYRGAQILEAVGLSDEVIDLCFNGMWSPLKGVGLEALGNDAVKRHAEAYAAKPALSSTGFIKHKAGGEYHAINPDVVDALHKTVGVADEQADEMEAAHALRRAARGDGDAYRRFSALVNERPPVEPRDLLDIMVAERPTALEEVEPAAAVVKRFSTGAMSHGALSAEAHETLSIALNMIGGMANTGEGGEAPERYRDERNSGIKQVASGRFGVTPDYLGFAAELQIKMAQGSKPGEGGQLPGKKVSVEIARLRHTVPGVALISPPPHHDIYSIEDLAQLIFDLKQANPRASVSVKLVASEGVGTIAAGVVKGLADVVHISGADGGTGASPLSSIKNAGLPWEVGLADTQRSLVTNGLRGRTRVRIDGGIKTGRDIILAALLGADEYSFGTAALIAEGCILVRTCHRNTCPVGIATQDPKLRAKFAGTPEMVAEYLMHVAEEVRSLLAALGFTTLQEAIGRTDLLRLRETGDARVDSLDLSYLLTTPREGSRFTGQLELQKPRSELGDRVYADAIEALGEGRAVDLRYPITTSDRTVGARLGCALGFELGLRKPAAHASVSFEGQAGQSFGAFLSDGIDFALEGEANDYVCKGMGGGRVVIRPPKDDAGEPVLIGNTVLYGATGGQLFVAGRAGERFAVRNSGAVAVVEGTGDHACEYMTAGAVVILGPTGVNLGAGMSGGEAYVYDDSGDLDAMINRQLVASYEPTTGQLESLKRVIEKHVSLTGSSTGTAIIDGWQTSCRFFRRVAPRAEVARLEALFEGTATAAA